jgi:hypothetical protein
MNRNTFSPEIQFLAEKPSWRVGLYATNLVFALLLIRYGRFFSDALTIPCSIVVISVFLYAGFTRLRLLGEGSRMKAYIKSHEAWALVVLAAFLIAGTIFFVAVESRLDAGSGSPRIAHS